MLFAKSDGPQQINILMKDMVQLQKLQQDVVKWYRKYMAAKTRELEAVLLAT